MDSRWKFVLYFSAIFFSNQGGSHALKLQLYEQENYNGFAGEFNLKGADETKCVNFQNGAIKINSVKIDKCVILYTNTDCTTPTTLLGISFGPEEWSHRFDKDTPRFGTDPKPTYPYNSFHVCSQELGGGPQLDLDIYDSWSYPNKIVQEYRGVCDCRNIPIAISRNHKIYVDMHGNTVKMFSGENCQGSSYQLGPHDRPDNHYLYNTLKFEPRSFQPVGLDHCYRLHADIYKFHFKNGTNDISSLPTTNVKLGVNAQVTNNGTSEDSHLYTLHSSVTKTVEYSIAKSITEMHSAGVEVGFETTAEAGVPIIASVEVTAKIGANYQWSQEHGSESTNTTTISEEEAVEVAQEMKIPGCNYCTISCVVKKVRDFPILYDLYAIVRADVDAGELTAAEVKKNLPAGMDYIRDHDKHSVEAKTSGTMFGEFGLEIITTKDCAPIKDCGPSKYTPQAPSHNEYHLPIKVISSKLKFTRSGGRSRQSIWSFLTNVFGRLLIRY